MMVAHAADHYLAVLSEDIKEGSRASLPQTQVHPDLNTQEQNGDNTNQQIHCLQRYFYSQTLLLNPLTLNLQPACH